jgi:tetratricopeptide (TPR) repeat protein
VKGHLVRFPRRANALPPQEGEALARRILTTPLAVRNQHYSARQLEDPEVLLNVCSLLQESLNANPAGGRAEAGFFYEFVEVPERPIGCFDEREFFLGEFALLSGMACRVLALRSDARRWFDRAEAKFACVQNAPSHFGRLAYQRLALRVEERDFEGVLELAPFWRDSLLKLGLDEETLKCRFLEATAWKETERYAEAEEVFVALVRDARAMGNERVAALALQNIFQIHAFRGDTKAAMAAAQEAAPILSRLNNRADLAKLQLGLGYLLRSQKNLGAAVEAYRTAQKEFREIGMRADVAATHLVLADLLLDVDQSARAEWEIRAALPVIDELKLVPEGIAALSLLRESLRRRQIDRHALRSLNGYFEELQS